MSSRSARPWPSCAWRLVGLGADFFIGLPPAELVRAADFIGMVDPPEGVSSDATDDEQLMVHHAYFNPRTFSGSGVVNTTAWRTAELPSTNGQASARGIARIYEALVPVGIAVTSTSCRPPSWPRRPVRRSAAGT